MRKISAFLKFPFKNNQSVPFLWGVFAALLLIPFSSMTPLSSRLLLGALLFLGGSIVYKSVLENRQSVPASLSDAKAPVTADIPAPSPLPNRQIPTLKRPSVQSANAQTPVPAMGGLPMMNEGSLMPTCAFLFNINSSSPSTFIIPDLACTNSLILVPKELSQFYNNSVMDVMRHDNPVRVLRPVNNEYRKALKKMSLNDTKTIIDNGSLILPIHFFSHN